VRAFPTTSNASVQPKVRFTISAIREGIKKASRSDSCVILEEEFVLSEFSQIFQEYSSFNKTFSSDSTRIDQRNSLEMGNQDSTPSVPELGNQTTELPKMKRELMNPTFNDYEWPKNMYGYYKTDVPRIDSIFDQAGEIFDEFELYRIQIKLRLNKVHELAGTKQNSTPHVLDAIKIMLYAFSANAGGKISDVLRVEGNNSLQLEVKGQEKVRAETWELYDALNDLLKAFIEESNASSDLTLRISNLINELTSITKEDYIVKTAQALKMSSEKLQLIIEKNEQMFNSMHRMMYALNENSLKIGNEYMKFLSNLQKYVKEADLIGAKAAEMQVFEPKKIAELIRQGKL